MAEYEVKGVVLDVTPDEVIYDYFVYKNKRIAVLRNEQFDEFLPENTEGESDEHQKLIMLGEIFSMNDSDYILPLDKDEYNEALQYYLSLKKCFLKVVDDE